MTDIEAITAVRRKNRQVKEEAWITAFLRNAPTCVIGSHDGQRVFLNPNTFVFDEDNDIFYFHTAGRGRTRSNLEQSPAVTIVVYEIGRLLPAPIVTDFSTEYASVVLFGRAVIVDDGPEARRLFEMQMRKYFPHHQAGRDYTEPTDEEIARATVYRVAIEGISAKQNAAAADHQGAHFYPWLHFARGSSAT
jgi:nitroimidazol reductase NimA-like FMN-containing flavoprotein (pyridoxamine 5'-phosphate oxidase superfamily)